jgi:hypothetical protein
LVKGQGYDVRQAISRDSEIRHPYYPLYFTFLVLVIEGRIVEVERAGSDIHLEPVTHAVAKTSYMPQYSDRVLDYLVDVVRKDCFDDYLRTVSNDFAAMTKAILADKASVLDYLNRTTHKGAVF